MSGIGIVRYDVETSYEIRDISKRLGIGWGSKYIVNHNVYYGLEYNAIHWKRFKLNIGAKVHYSISTLTWPDPYTYFLLNEDTVAGINVKGTSVVEAFPGHQLIFEPYAEVELRLFKKLAWSLHIGSMLGNRSIYTIKGNYSFNGIPQPEGEVRTDGTGMILSTGFKFYFKSPQTN